MIARNRLLEPSRLAAFDSPARIIDWKVILDDHDLTSASRTFVAEKTLGLLYRCALWHALLIQFHFLTESTFLKLRVC